MDSQGLGKRKVQLGRKAGTFNKSAARTDISVKTIRLYADKPFPLQLKAIRDVMGISGVDMAKRIGLAPSNIHHFENQNLTNGNPYNSTKNAITETALKYAKALGATKIEIIL